MSLIALRGNPRNVMSNLAPSVFRIDSSSLGANGTPINIAEGTDNIFTVLSPTAAGASTDYFFPYTMLSAGGVQITNLVDGSIALTGGMNGCALDVRWKNNQYWFYHDNNGQYMNNVNNPGTCICRIESPAYWVDVVGVDANGDMRYPEFQFISVYKGSYWHVGCYGLIRTHDSKTGKLKSVSFMAPKNGVYMGYFNDSISLIKKN